MKLQINTDKTTPQDLRAAASMLLELAGTSAPNAEITIPADLDIASGKPTVPKVVTVYTSEGNEELAKEYLNVNDTVDRVDVRLADDDADKAKRTRTRKPRKDKGKPRSPKLESATVTEPDVPRRDTFDPNPVKIITTEEGVVVGHLNTTTGEISGDIVRDPSLAEKIKTVGGQDGEVDLNVIREKLAAIRERQTKRDMLDRLAEPVTDPNRDPVELPTPAVETLDMPDAKEVVEAVVNVKTEKVEMEGSIDEALTAVDPMTPEGDLITEKQVARLRELRVEAAKLDVFADFRKIVVDACGQAGKFTEIPLDVANEILPKLDEIITNAQEGAAVAE